MTLESKEFIGLPSSCRHWFASCLINNDWGITNENWQSHHHCAVVICVLRQIMFDNNWRDVKSCNWQVTAGSLVGLPYPAHADLIIILTRAFMFIQASKPDRPKYKPRHVVLFMMKASKWLRRAPLFAMLCKMRPENMLAHLRWMSDSISANDQSQCDQQQTRQRAGRWISSLIFQSDPF